MQGLCDRGRVGPHGVAPVGRVQAPDTLALRRRERSGLVRWDRLFEDLEGQLHDEELAQRDADVVDRIRAERSRITLGERLRRHRGPIHLVLQRGRLIVGDVLDAGAGWVVVQDGARGRALVPTAVVVEIEGLGWAGQGTEGVSAQLGLGHPLRALARDRAVVEIEDVIGRSLVGTIDAVGADAVEVALHPRDEPRRPANVWRRPTIPFSAIVCVTALGPA